MTNKIKRVWTAGYGMVSYVHDNVRYTLDDRDIRELSQALELDVSGGYFDQLDRMVDEGIPLLAKLRIQKAENLAQHALDVDARLRAEANRIEEYESTFGTTVRLIDGVTV